MKCFLKPLTLLFYICLVSLIYSSKLKMLQDENVCMDHARWVLENQNHPNHDWKNYVLNNVQDARLWLACYEPQTCKKNNNDNCENLQKKNKSRVYKFQEHKCR